MCQVSCSAILWFCLLHAEQLLLVFFSRSISKLLLLSQSRKESFQFFAMKKKFNWIFLYSLLRFCECFSSSKEWKTCCESLSITLDGMLKSTNEQRRWRRYFIRWESLQYVLHLHIYKKTELFSIFLSSLHKRSSIIRLYATDTKTSSLRIDL